MRIDIRNVFNEKPKKLKEIIEAEAQETGQAEKEPEDSSSPESSQELKQPEEKPAEPEESADDEEEEPAAEPDESADGEEADAEVEAEQEPEKEAEPFDEPQESEETETEDRQDTETETSAEPTDEQQNKASFGELRHKYGSLVMIAAAFILLLGFMFAYTTMIPREIHAVVDGKPQRITTKEYTVAGFLKEQKIEYCEEDYISTPPDGFLHDGMKLKLVHAMDFKVTADGRTKRFKSLEETVGEALADVGLKVRKRDIVTPKPDSPLTDNMKITVNRVEFEKITVKEKVPFETIIQYDTTMNEGEKKVVTEGKNGRDRVTYEVTYIDGEESSRKELNRKVIKPVVDEVVANGTRILYNGKSYSRKLVVKAYSYTGGGTTAMGTRARVGEIAVDPRIIPLGTNVYIEGVGARRAEDTGGNIKGNTIDIYMNTHAECIRWGVRYVTIYIE